MSADELGLNIVPQYCDMNIRFMPVTRDGATIDFSGVQAWIFAMSNSISGTPTVLKASTGTLTSGDFVINGVNSSVTVGVRSSEISYGYGTWYTTLAAQVSGRRITHRQKYLTIERQIATTGI